MVYSTRRFVLSLSMCYFVLVLFSLFSTAITSLGEEKANISAFRTFVRFAPVWFRLFPLPLRVWDGLRLVIVALPGLASYLLWYKRKYCQNMECSGLIQQRCHNHHRPDFVHGKVLSKYAEFRLVILTNVKTITDQTWYKRKYCQNMQNSELIQQRVSKPSKTRFGTRESIVKIWRV